MSSPERRQLSQALQERNINLSEDDTAWAFDSANDQEQLRSWVREYLGTATLLTLEEQHFSDKLGRPKETLSSLPVSDQSFEDAISALEASTASIEKQCRLMEAQKQALERLSAARSRPSEANETVDTKTSREQSRLDFECDELADGLHAQFRTALRSSGQPSSSTITVERVLEKDDRLLDGLQRILPQLSATTNDLEGLAEVEKLCHALTATRSAEIRSQVDGAYLQNAQSHTAHVNGINGKASPQARQLHAELDELCREIDGLATMVVDAEYLKPVRQATEAASHEAMVERTAWAEYTTSTLQFLAARLEYVQEHSEDQKARVAATRSMATALEQVLAVGAGGKGDSNGQGPKSPMKPALQKGLKPLRLVQANLSDSQDPATQVLRQLDVRLAGDIDAAALAKVGVEKTDKLHTLQSTLEHNMTDQLAQSLLDAGTRKQQLLRSVFVHSTYGTVHAENEEIRSSIGGLEETTQTMSERMRTLDVEGMVKASKQKQQEFLASLPDA